MAKSYKIPSGPKKFLFPSGIPALIDGTNRARFLRRLSHTYPKGSLAIPESSQPDTLEFFTKVLGHGEKETKKRLYRAAYSDARRQFPDGIHDIKDEIMEELNLPASFVSACDSLIITKLFSRRLPRDEQHFNHKKTKVINSLYSRYQKERTKHMRQKGTVVPSDITIEEFEKSMERLIGFRAVERQMKLAHEKALKSLSRKWIDKLRIFN